MCVLFGFILAGNACKSRETNICIWRQLFRGHSAVWQHYSRMGQILDQYKVSKLVIKLKYDQVSRNRWIYGHAFYYFLVLRIPGTPTVKQTRGIGNLRRPTGCSPSRQSRQQPYVEKKRKFCITFITTCVCLCIYQNLFLRCVLTLLQAVAGVAEQLERSE